MVAKSDYIKAGNASDIPNRTSRIIYRGLEILPGALAWVTILGIFLASRFLPVAASFFIIAFDLYWLLKTVFLSLHLRAGYRQMERHLKIEWLAKLNALDISHSSLVIRHWSDIYHLVILPFYQEPYEVLRNALEAISKNTYPKDRIMVVLGCEARAGAPARAIAERLKQEYAGKFFKFLISFHPGDITGELAGKGANETWACRQAKEKLIDPLSMPYERVIVSSLDVDTVLLSQYLAILTYHYLTAPYPLRSSYQPIPVYNNNIWEAPAFSRVVATSGTFWQTMQQVRPERLATFSSHSMPFKALVEMDYWHTNIVSEDSRIFWQSLLFYDSDWRAVPLYYPVWMDANVAPTFVETAKNVYKQQRRWGWGVENVPYLLFGFLQNKRIAFKRKLYFSFNQLEGFWSWATNALIIFFLGWLPIFLGPEQFGATVLAYNLPRFTRWLMTISMLGMITSAYISIRMLSPRPPAKPKRMHLWMAFQWVMLPLTIIIFGAFPGLEAQTRLMFGRYMGFWVTPKYRTEEGRAQARPGFWLDSFG